MSESISDYKKFKSMIVDKDFDEFNGHPADIRRGFHCSISLFHLADWVYVAHKNSINRSWKYKKRDIDQCVKNSSQFANALADQCPDFELIRSVANAAKHLELRKRSQARTVPDNVPSDAANVQVKTWESTVGGIAAAPQAGAPIGSGVLEQKVFLKGDVRPLLVIAENVKSMWGCLFEKHRW